MLRRVIKFALPFMTLVLLAGCGGESTPSKSEPAAKEPRARAFLGEIPRKQPPAISVLIRLRHGGGVRLTYQIGLGRPFRDERGKWTQSGDEVTLEFEPSDHRDGPLPSPIPMRFEGEELVALAGSFADEEIRFLPYRKGP